MLLDFCATLVGDDDGSAYAATSAAELAEDGSPALGRLFFVLLVVIAPSFLLLPLVPEPKPPLLRLLLDAAATNRFFPSVESIKNRSVLRELSDAKYDAPVCEDRCPLSQLGVTSLLVSASGFLKSDKSTLVSHCKSYASSPVYTEAERTGGASQVEVAGCRRCSPGDGGAGLDRAVPGMKTLGNGCSS